jgi:hypothetical protein
MSLRRIAGCAVMMVLLASVALPAMCGACMDFAAKAACGEKHDGGASGSRQLATAMDGHCADCGDQPGITANERGRYAAASEVMLLDCSQGICVQAGERSAAIYRDGVTARRWVGDRATFGVAAEIGSPALRAVHPNVFASGKRSSRNSAYQPLTVSLKI